MIASFAVTTETACTPLTVQEDFNITEYLRATWYVQKQQKNGYQPLSSLNCVTATYNETYNGVPAKVPFFSGEVFTVYNDCRKDSKDGPVCNNFTSPDFKPSFAIPLCGRVPDTTTPAKITVAPCKLPNIFAGNYWVAAAGPRPDNYQYAIVVAGQPSVELSDGCTTPDTCSNPAQFSCGLWFFTRDPVPDATVIASLMEAAKKKNISTQLLKTVDQEGCKYDGYELKRNLQRHEPDSKQVLV
jgi:hypothetical protein